jgi:hypothetical protein
VTECERNLVDRAMELLDYLAKGIHRIADALEHPTLAMPSDAQVTQMSEWMNRVDKLLDAKEDLDAGRP